MDYIHSVAGGARDTTMKDDIAYLLASISSSSDYSHAANFKDWLEGISICNPHSNVFTAQCSHFIRSLYWWKFDRILWASVLRRIKREVYDLWGELWDACYDWPSERIVESSHFRTLVLAYNLLKSIVFFYIAFSTLIYISLLQIIPDKSLVVSLTNKVLKYTRQVTIALQLSHYTVLLLTGPLSKVVILGRASSSWLLFK